MMSPSRRKLSTSIATPSPPETRDDAIYVRNQLTGKIYLEHHHHLVATPPPKPKFAWIANKHTATKIRAFDLGTEGLKTALFTVTDGAVDPIPVEVKRLGKAPGEVGGVAHRRRQSVAAWLQHLVPQIELECRSAEVLFAASLGKLEHLWEDGKRREDTEDFGKLIGLPDGHPLASCSDDLAHLRASQSMVAGAPLCAISIGASVGMCLTNAFGETRFGEEMAELYQLPLPSALRVSSSSSSSSLSSPSLPSLSSSSCTTFADLVFDPGDGEQRTAREIFGGAFEGNVRRSNPCASCERQAIRWHAFLTADLPGRCALMGWPAPKVFAFTGGIPEHSDLVHRLRVLGLYATLGPPNAGLLGAAIRAMD